MSFITLDIESVPPERHKVIDDIIEKISPPKNITKDESKAKWLEINFDAEVEKEYRKLSLDGLYGQIISIAWAIDDGEINCVYRSSYDESEATLLRSFFAALCDFEDDYGNRIGITKWVGHYATFFDFRFIWQRCVINGVKPLIDIPYDAKPWDNNVFDTKVAWTGSSQYSGAGSLDKLSSVMLGESKGEINGSNVFDYFLRGEIDKIVKYNIQDVELTRKLYKKMNFIM